MKKIFTTVLFLFSVLLTFAAAPTEAPKNLAVNSTEGNSINIAWANGNGSGRIVIAKKSAPVTAKPVNGVTYAGNSEFGAGNEIAPGEFVVYSGNQDRLVMTGLNSNTTYYLAIFEYNGTAFNTEYLTTAFLSGAASTLSAPTIQTSNAKVVSFNGNSLQLEFTPGNGRARLVLAKAGSPVDANPTDLVNYNPSSAFGSGTEIGNGNFVVSETTASTTSVVNLLPGSTYHFAVFEYNGVNHPAFLNVSPATVTQQTAPRPSIASSAMKFTNVEGNSMTVGWINGNGVRRVVIAKANSPVTAVPVDGTAYAANREFGKGTQINTGEFVVYNGTETGFSLTGLSTGITYHLAVFEYDGTLENPVYLTTAYLSGNNATILAPRTQSSGVTFSNITNNAANISFTPGDGRARIVVMKNGSPVDAVPQNYSAYGTGADLGNGNKVVVLTTSDNGILGSLNPGSTYYVKVFEYNGLIAPVYLTANPAEGSFTTSAAPTIPASAISTANIEPIQMELRWNNGNGQRRILVASTKPITGLPQDGKDYAANPEFGKGDQVAPGEYVVFDNTSFISTVTALTPGTTYYFAVFEYNGTGTATKYLVEGFPTNTGTTVAKPTRAASAITVSEITSNRARITFTPGNGTGRIVVIRANEPVNSLPVDYTFYYGSQTFGNGSQVGTGNYTILANATYADVYNFQPNTTYHITIFELNGQSKPIYLTEGAPVASFTTASAPTVPSQNISINNIEGNGMRVNWTSGNGRGRILVAREGSPVTAVPETGRGYRANAAFGNGEEIKPGEFVVYNGNFFFADINNMKPGVTYHFALYEYDYNATDTFYLFNQFAIANQVTKSAPNIQTSNIFFTNVTNTTVNINWTNGNGNSRILVGKKGAPVDTFPTNFVYYFGYSMFGTNGNMGKNNYVVYNSGNSLASVTNLEPGTTYYFQAFEYNGSTGAVYMVPGSVQASVTTIGMPAQQATDLTVAVPVLYSAKLSWKNGSGNKRIVLAKKGAPVDAVPADNTSYAANTYFGSGDKIGNNNFVVYAGENNNVTVTNLVGGSDYFFALFEYNDFGAVKLYNTTGPLTGIATWAVLPLTWESFTAEKTTEGNLLQWITSNEVNNQYFEVERSADGRIFRTIAQLASKATTGGTYRYTDAQVQNGKTWYRIKQVYKDGRFSYSPVVQLKTLTAASVKLLGNPVSSVLRLSVNTTAAKLAATITDNTGRVIMRTSLNNNSIQQVSVSQLAAGIYYLTVISSDGTITLPFIKQ